MVAAWANPGVPQLLACLLQTQVSSWKYAASKWAVHLGIGGPTTVYFNFKYCCLLGSLCKDFVKEAVVFVQL